MSAKAKNPFTTAVRVAAYIAQDRLGLNRATRRDQIPGSASQITPEWLTDVFCRDTPGAQVTGRTILGRTLGTHERAQIELTYNQAGQDAGLPRNIFTKALPTVTTRMLVGFMGHSRYEMLFYRNLAPTLGIETPVCYHSASDKVRLSAIHVLEDLGATKQATFGDETTLLTRDLAEDMVDLLATIHGKYYLNPALDAHRWLVNYYDWFSHGIVRVRMDHYHAKALTAAAHVIPPDLMARREEIWPATLRAANIHRAGPRTLIHSDVHIGNWYVTGDQRMGLFDWQCVNTGHWSRDVSYALSSCLTIENRRAWERELLERYIARMQEHSGHRLDFGEAWDQYRAQTLHALTMWTQTLCHPPFQPSSQTDSMTFELLRRISTAMSDLEAIDAVKD